MVTYFELMIITIFLNIEVNIAIHLKGTEADV